MNFALIWPESTASKNSTAEPGVVDVADGLGAAVGSLSLAEAICANAPNMTANKPNAEKQVIRFMSPPGNLGLELRVQNSNI
jgi:hypothetical protein